MSLRGEPSSIEIDPAVAAFVAAFVANISDGGQNDYWTFKRYLDEARFRDAGGRERLAQFMLNSASALSTPRSEMKGAAS